MTWTQCPYRHCRFSWEPRTDHPKRCPKCSNRLDTPWRWDPTVPRPGLRTFTTTPTAAPVAAMTAD
jgi:hypothetical protein